MKMKNTSYGYNIIRPRSSSEHKYSKYKNGHTMMMWGIGLFHLTKSQNHRNFKDINIFYNMSLHHENIILAE